jgi:hypothetical protein
VLSPTRPVPRLNERSDIAPDDTITAMAIAAAMPNFIVFFINGVVEMRK